MKFKEYYNILKVSRDASDKDIKKAYRKLATQYHPDKTKADKASEEKFKEISEAYQVLGNTEKRKQYDALGSDWEQFQRSGASYDEFMQQRSQYQRSRNRQRYAYTNADSGFGNGSGFSDFFEAFFGSGAGNRGAYGFPGGDVSGKVIIDLTEAYHGTERLLEWGGQRIKLKIKPGAYTGLQLRAKGRGQKGSQGQAGDLYVDIEVREHAIYKREGDHLHMNLSVDVFKALLGGKQDVITLSGKVKIPIKEGTQNGKTIRLRGKGMPKYGKLGQYGDLFVTINIQLPNKLSPRQKELIREIQNSR
ncbi:J domain-containing protein [Ulvibacterium sp.]|uniref:J domain-containing protein n=1 Tax=Ulvibacterium sp. TaxID=2665914 RepID=UPI00261E1562|nr:J domain-containing protein [Ulvibacterium sp.]